jgi:hypothetical protein
MRAIRLGLPSSHPRTLIDATLLTSMGFPFAHGMVTGVPIELCFRRQSVQARGMVTT